MKNNKTIIKVFLTSTFVLAMATGCNKDYLDINENPNFPEDVSVVELLPSAELAIAHAMGNNIQIFGGLWGQYWTQSTASSQFKTIEQYSPGANDFDRPWKALYADALKDLKTIITKATAEDKPNYIACAKILQAYTFQVLTDNWGDVPFYQALQAETGILSPAYDTQHDIYHGIIDLTKEGLALIDESADVVPGSEDVLFNGDMFLWREFANTLLLRVYLRMAYVDDVEASEGIGALEDSASEYFYPGENAMINYLSVGGNTNPLYSYVVDVGFTQNLVASATAINFMNNNFDPRVDLFYVPSSAGQLGLPQGAYQLPAGTPVSIPSATVGGDANDEASAEAPVKLMTGYESLFLQAEAFARGWMAGDAEATYRAAITESFETYGITGDPVTYYLDSVPATAYPTGGTVEQQVEAIITQKWIAMCGQEGSEGWIEWRRTGYPTFFSPSVNSIIGGNRFPERFFYPSAEVTRNANFPGQKLIYEKMWWDVN